MGRQTDRVIAKLNNATAREVVRLALDIHGGLVERTPVDTGWARNNWIPSVGQPKMETAGSVGNIDSTPVTAGLAAVARWDISAGSLYVTNNVPYIGKLNSGSSKQAPAGFVESTVQTATQRANRRRLR